jgi:hypothetical protein
MNQAPNTGNQTPDPVRPREISDLLAWARTLTQAGPATDPAERVAYLTAKADLLARIAATTGDPAAARIAADAATTAHNAAAQATGNLAEHPKETP